MSQKVRRDPLRMDWMKSVGPSRPSRVAHLCGCRPCVGVRLGRLIRGDGHDRGHARASRDSEGQQGSEAVIFAVVTIRMLPALCTADGS